MDFRFDDDELTMIEQARVTFLRRLPPERLLSNESTAAAWHALAADGWLDVSRVQDDGTETLPLPVIAGIARETGKVLAGEAYATNTVVLANGPEELAPGFLISDGRNLGSVTCDEHGHAAWCFGVEPGMTGYRITSSGTLFATEPADWTFTPAGQLDLGVGLISSRRETAVGRIVLAEPHIQRAKLVHAATLVGLGDRAIGLAVEHALQRTQFGHPIGSFQGVKHPLADAAVALEIAWNSVLYGTLRTDEITVATAQLQAKRAVDLATRTAVQALGGIAMTWEHPAHLYLKCSMAGRHRFGTTESHVRTVAMDLLTNRNAA